MNRSKTEQQDKGVKRRTRRDAAASDDLALRPAAFTAQSQMPRGLRQRDRRADQVVATLTELRPKGDASLTTRHAAEHYRQQRAMTKHDECAEVRAPTS